MFDLFFVNDILNAQESMDSARATAQNMSQLELERLVANTPSNIILGYYKNPLGLERASEVSIIHKKKFYLGIASAERLVDAHGHDYILSIYGFK